MPEGSSSSPDGGPQPRTQRSELPVPPATHPPLSALHLWDIAFVRDLLVVAALGALVCTAFVLRAITLPVAVAFVLAHVFDPLVGWAKRRLRVPRWLGALTCVSLVLALVGLAGAVVVPRLVQTVRELVRDLPRYLSALPELSALPLAQLRSFEAVEPWNRIDSQQVMASASRAFGFAADLAGATTYALLGVVFTLLCFAYFLARFPSLPKLRPLLPASQRDRVGALVDRFIEVFGGFVRGQLIVAAFTSVGFYLGFSLAGVPHAIVPAALGGLLSIVPNGQASGWLLAVLLTTLAELSHGQEFSALRALFYPTLVYTCTQSLETFVITPWVQGSYTRLHPLAVLGALIGGAALGGIAGILLAIPVAACAKIFLLDVVLPAWKARAGRV